MHTTASHRSETVGQLVLVDVDPTRRRVNRAIAGFLAGYTGTTREASRLDLRQWATWIDTARLGMFDNERARNGKCEPLVDHRLRAATLGTLPGRHRVYVCETLEVLKQSGQPGDFFRQVRSGLASRSRLRRVEDVECDDLGKTDFALQR